jgi:hypothetical protein
MEPRPFRQRYFAIIGFAAAAFCVFRILRGDYEIAAALGVVAGVLFVAAARDVS